jgi:hypothetical protein
MKRANGHVLTFLNDGEKNEFVGEAYGFWKSIEIVNIVPRFRSRKFCKPIVKFALSNLARINIEELKNEDPEITLFMRSKMPVQACNCYVKAELELGLVVYQTQPNTRLEDAKFCLD